MAKECSNTNCSKESCEGCPSRGGAVDFSFPMNDRSRIHHVIGVISGKGGVGKSSVTAMLAVYLNRQGYRVGILDADVTGPSIPRMLGVHEIEGVENESVMLPGISAAGIKVMSINLVLETEDTPVIWRGPVLCSVIRQFWSDVVCGELDYLLVDMPPGTGDVALTVFQSLPVDGVILVSSPQNLVEMIVAKAYHMAEMMHIPVLGVVENFSFLRCPDCGKIIPLFGESRLEEWAGAHGIPLLKKLPLDPEMTAYADTGRMEYYPNCELEEIASSLPKD